MTRKRRKGLRDSRRDQSNRLFARPVRFADKAADLDALSVIKDADRQDIGAADRHCEPQGRIGVKLQIANFQTVEKFLRRFRPARIGCDGDDFETPPAKLGFKRIERRQLFQTGRAPGRPQIDENGPAAKIFKGEPLAMMVETDFRRAARRECVFKIGHLADQQRTVMIKRGRAVSGAGFRTCSDYDVKEICCAETGP